MNHLILSWLLLTFSFSIIAQQNTVGLLTYDSENIEPGYTLIFPRNQPNVFLLNNCGEIVHTWEDNAPFVPNNAVYILPNGNLVKCKKMANFPAGGLIGSGGGGAFVEILSWENELLWSYELNSEEARLHHDVEVLPNGNILMIAWKHVPYETAIAHGRLPEHMTQGSVFPDWIFEVNPMTDEIVWEWFAFDHIIQDVDSTKLNYGVVSEHPELIDFNYVVNNGILDWLHINAVDYNAELDQIMLCVPYFDEMWIIDHSTTTEEAAGHTGGNAGLGGDLLYRVGNPLAYKSGIEEDKILGFPHDTHWASEFLSPDHPDYGKVLIFNNKGNENYSSMEIFDLPFDTETMSYPKENGIYIPSQFTGTRTHPNPLEFYSTGLSGLQALPNGNLLACSGRQGYLLELTPENDIVWEYIVPFNDGDAATQFSSLSLGDNLTFRASKYPENYIAFENRDLTPKGFIELNPQEDYCDRLVPIEESPTQNISISPNPAQDFLEITWTNKENIELSVVDILGKTRIVTDGHNGQAVLSIHSLEQGLYFIALGDKILAKFIKE